MTSFGVQVRWDGEVVSGITSVTPLSDSVEVVTLREGGSDAVRKIPGRSDVRGVVLEREVTADLTFDLWACGPLLRKDVELELLASSDSLMVVYRLYRCWVSGYAVSPDLATGVVRESLTLATDGWERIKPPAADLADGIARSRGSAVQRVHLGALLTGSVAETARNLGAVLDEASQTGAILLFDEADALFGKRTDVADAHDHFAPTEVDAVRDILARHQGQVVVSPPDPS